MKLFCVTTLALFSFVLVEGCPHHNCPSYWTNFGDSCYRYFSSPKTWVEAEAFCKLSGAPNGQGIAHLASVLSEQEQNFLYEHWATHRDFVNLSAPIEYTSNKEYPAMWIGLNDIAANTVWVWTDGSPYDYENWLVHEPNNCCGGESAVHFWDGPDHLGGWNDIAHNSEEWKFPFTCKMRKSTCH